MKPIEWLLAHLDEPGVSEIVLGIGRPVAVRASEGYRPITSMNFERHDIETLVAGTPLSGLIGSPSSLPPAEINIDTRRLVVEVVRQGYNAAIRIALFGSPDASARKPGSTVPPRTATTTTPPRVTTNVPPPEEPPIVSVRINSPTSAPRTASATTAPRPAATTPPPQPVVAEEPPIVRMTTPTPPPRSPSATSAPRTVAATAPPAMASFFPPLDEPVAAEPALAVDPDVAATLGGGGEIEEDTSQPDEGMAVGGEVYASDWYGPQIIDEHADLSAVSALLEAAYRRTASALHVIAGQPVTIRRLGELVALDFNALVEPYDRAVYQALIGPLDRTMAERFLLPLLGPSAQQRLSEIGYVDLGFQVPGRGRIRANISQQQDGLAGSFRLCRHTIPTLDGLGLPRELEKCVRHHQGLVVIAGPSGHGKTTTMAALVDLLNTSNSDHIITIEDPVEIAHPPKRAIVSHREVGRHTLSFVSALKASLREDPDVIVIGELRDRETVEIALAAAETGHLVLSTISTPSAMKTIDRLIDMFPPDDQVQVRASISGTLRAVIAQRLLPNATRDGLVAAIEMVTGVLPLATMIRDNKLYQLPSLMQRGRAFGMIRLDDSLAEHVRAKRITEDVALAAAENKKELAVVLSGRPATSTTGHRGLFGGKGST